MAQQRFSTPTQNNNNYMTERSSTRLHKPPGGGSTVGSLIFGGAPGHDEPSYMDDRKARRFTRSDAPEANPIVDKTAAASTSYYGTPTIAQRDRESITMPPGTMSRESLSASQKQKQQYGLGNSNGAIVRRNASQQSAAATGDYFAGGMGNQDDSRRTKRMYGPPGGASSFKLG